MRSSWGKCSGCPQCTSECFCAPEKILLPVGCTLVSQYYYHFFLWVFILVFIFVGHYYYNDFPAPEYWPINPGFANGTVASNLGIFNYVLELTDYTGQPDGSTGNFAKFEIEAQ